MKRMLLRFLRKKRVLMFTIIMVHGIPFMYGQSPGCDIGVGGGLSYGGLGSRFTCKPFEIVGLFGSLGYNLDALGYNVGMQLHVPSQKNLSFYLTGMYGYNTVMIVDAIVMKSKTTYFGFSTGIGAEFRMQEKLFLSAEILLPFRPQAYKNAMDDLRSINYEVKDPLPVALSVGYHIKF